MEQAVQMATQFGGALAEGRYDRAVFRQLNGVADDFDPRPLELQSLAAQDLLTGYAIGHPFSEARFHAAVAAIMQNTGQYEEYGAVSEKPHVARSIVRSLIQALEDKRASVREAAAGGLGILRDLQAVPPLIHALGDRTARVRSSAVSALAQFSDPRSLEALIDSFRDESADVRLAAVRGSRFFSDPRLVTLLARRLRDKSEEVRAAAARELQKLEDPRSAVPDLIRALWDESVEVRIRAVFALGKIQDPRVEEALIRVLHVQVKDQESEVRRNVFCAIHLYGLPLSYRRLDELLSLALRDRNELVRYEVAAVLGDLMKKVLQKADQQ